MEIVVDRKFKKPTYTISNLTINGKWFCNVIEDTDRDLDNTMSPSYIRKIKDVNGNGLNDDSITAIPRGTYKITLDTFSPRFGNKSFYKKVCGGKLPRILNIKGFDGVLIHCGNTNLDTSGCILVGRNLEVGKVLKSQETFERLYRILKGNKDNLTIKIV